MTQFIYTDVIDDTADIQKIEQSLHQSTATQNLQ